MLIHIHRVKCSSFSDLEFVEAEIQSSVLTVSMKPETVSSKQLWFVNFYHFTISILVLPSYRPSCPTNCPLTTLAYLYAHAR